MPSKDLLELREKLEKHLEESGEIRADLKWLKKAMWALAGAGLTFNLSLATAIFAYLLKK